ncbi:glyoxylase-like metal-dependent hydrolase (beta-lactamase superfamily II) [Sphingobium sp. B1D7B]|uniref:MBL fold metallo-hydrolase n=1 Tax=Sphingobium sp. B1D7B TaxID=2940578 RepID=UPI00222503BC|nr:MBL fold metallo-hydrolase [Sphingobium sp. B1D7B]MCW2406909.1 glyoxylase-like metal-dependent hydrolase (beta-lactamase superfamily II) [Sphingobium sp. B1D7B]
MNRLAKRVVARLSGATLLAATALSAAAVAQGAERTKPLTVEVLQTSEGSLLVNSALIMGEKEAILVDPPFTNADAHRVAAMVLDSGKTLRYIFVTHDHPDHFFAMPVLAAAFPDAQIVAHPTVVVDIWRSLPMKVKRWGPMLGANGPAYPSAPKALTSDTLTLEGHELKVLPPMQGDHIHSTALWAPEIKALFPGDLVFNKVHLWLGEHRPENVRGWSQSIAKLAELKPTMVVPGHSKAGLANDASGLAFTRDYLAAWPQLIAQSKNSTDFMAKVRAKFPDTIDVLNGFILPNSAKVAMGEEKPWEE